MTAWAASFKMVVVLEIIVAQKIHFVFPVLVGINNNLGALRGASVSLVG